MPTQSSSTGLTVQPYASVAVIGAGAWGTALAMVASSAGAQVTLWAREPEVVESLRNRHENTLFLPGVRVPDAIEPVGDIACASAAEAVVLATPAQHGRSVLEKLRGVLKPGTPVVLSAKGIEIATGLLPPEVLRAVVPAAEPAVLSGPSFARDVAQGLPTAVTIAAGDKVAARLAATLSRPGFRPYVSDDIMGVALGGAAKNVYAIACGMVDGAGLGESARAATISRGFAELLRLGAAIGAKPETLIGLSGLGDLVLTATSLSSRNFALGAALAKGASLDEISGAGRPLAEGAATAPALIARARAIGVELPIAEAVAEVLSGKLGVRSVVERLLSRPLARE